MWISDSYQCVRYLLYWLVRKLLMYGNGPYFKWLLIMLTCESNSFILEQMMLKKGKKKNEKEKKCNSKLSSYWTELMFIEIFSSSLCVFSFNISLITREYHLKWIGIHMIFKVVLPFTSWRISFVCKEWMTVISVGYAKYEKLCNLSFLFNQRKYQNPGLLLQAWPCLPHKVGC